MVRELGNKLDMSNSEIISNDSTQSLRGYLILFVSLKFTDQESYIIAGVKDKYIIMFRLGAIYF